MMTEKEAFKLGNKEANKGRVPLYATLVAAAEKDLACAYERGWFEATGIYLRNYRIGPSR